MNMSITCTISNAAMQARVRENRVKLDACTGPHTFEPVTDGRMRYICTKCTGVMDAESLRVYCQGQAHGVLRAAAA